MLRFHVVSMLLCSAILLGCNDGPEEHHYQQERNRKERQQDWSARVEKQQIQFSGESSLRVVIDYAGGNLDLVQDTTGLLADIELEFDREENRPRIEYNSSVTPPELRIRSPKRREEHMDLDELRDNHWYVKLRPDLPIEFEINCGAVYAGLDFANLVVAALEVNVGAGKLEMEFDTPNPQRPRVVINAGAASAEATGLCNANFRYLEFNGGAGKSRLEFDGEYEHDGEVELNLGVGLNKILLPRHLGARIHKDGSFLSPISLHGFEKHGDTYYSENYDDATGRLDFDISMGVGHTSINWID